MGVAYSQDLRDRVMAAVDGGWACIRPRRCFGSACRTIYKALGRRRASGDVTAHKSGGGPKPKLAAHDEALRAYVAQKADVTLIELQARLADDCAVKVSVGALWARLRHLGLTLKKVATRRRAGPRRRSGSSPAMAGSTGEWWPDNLVFVDETGASTKMTRLYGRCPRGERLVAPVPWGHWKTTTVIGALRQDGLVAPCAFDGPINGETFRAFLEQFLTPELREGDIVILDNLPSHKVAGVRTAIENAGASLLYLPSYSPDLNPIEQWFAKLKALLRKVVACKRYRRPVRLMFHRFRN